MKCMWTKSWNLYLSSICGYIILAYRFVAHDQNMWLNWFRNKMSLQQCITLVVVLLSGFALPHHHPNHNNQQCVGWRQASRQRTARHVGLIPVLELGFGLSAVEALNALSIAVARVQISITDATHEGTTIL